MAARTRIEQEPNYSYVAARLLLDDLRREAMDFLGQEGAEVTQAEMTDRYPDYFVAFIKRGVELELLAPELARYDLARLGAALKPERDLKFTYLGLQTLYDRYFIHHRGVRFELPQAFFMRVAMGLALNEIDREDRAIEFYELLSSFDFMSSTPTLFNSGTLRPQLSSCYLTTVPDDLEGIYDAIKDNALLSKYAGGLGNDWTRVRGLGAHIKGTNGKSQGVVPFLKVANDTAVAVNQGGKRLGAVCAYLETWHLDIEEFLELRKNTGDDRRRTHDMNTANWIPDLFMKRVAEDGPWTLFSPSDTADLHELVGKPLSAATSNMKPRWTAARSPCSSACPPFSCGGGCFRCCSRPDIPGSLSKILAISATPISMWGSAQFQSVHRNHPPHQRPRDRGVQSGFGQSGCPYRRQRYPRRPQAGTDRRHRHADAG